MQWNFRILDTPKEEKLAPISKKTKNLPVEDEKNSLSLVQQCAQWALEKKAQNVILLDLKGHSSIADYFLLMSASSQNHAKSLAKYISLSLGKNGIKSLKEEGLTDGRWILLDAGDFVVHIFQDYMRDFYDMETLWSHATQKVIRDKFRGNK